MRLFDTFFESLKITWKIKPMWKFTLIILTPILIISTTLMMALVTFMILSDGTIEIPFSIGETDYILITIAFLVTTLIYLFAYLGGTIGIQVGSNTVIWHHYLSSIKKMDRWMVFRTAMKQIFPGLPFFLVFVALPYCMLFAVYFIFIFYMETIESVFPMVFLFGLMLLFVPLIYIGFYLLHLILPVLVHDYLGFKKRIQLIWEYIRSNTGNLFLYCLVVGAADLVANIILYIPYYIFSMVAIIPFVLGIPLLGSNSTAAVILFFIMIIIYTLIITLFSIAQLLLLTFKQSAFTTMYCQWYNSSETARRIAPLPKPIQFNE